MRFEVLMAATMKCSIYWDDAFFYTGGCLMNEYE
jgi:hypothetical protein